MADPNYIDKFSDPEFQKDFESMTPSDQDAVLKSMGMSRVGATLAPMLASKNHRQGLQPQKGEPQPQSDWMKKLAEAATMGAATTMGVGALGTMLPAGVAPAVGVGLKAAGTGAVAGGLDALWGGKHPIQTGLDTAITTGVLDLPAESAAVRALLPAPLKKLYDLFSKTPGATQWEPYKAKPGVVTPFGGTTDPGYSPPSAPIKLKPQTETPPWEPYRAKPGVTRPSIPTPEPLATIPLKVQKTKAASEGLSLAEWIKKQKAAAIKGIK